MDLFDKILEEDEFVQRQRERGFQQGRLEGEIEGRIQGRIEGKIKAYQMVLVDIVKDKFPSLEDLAQQRAAQTGEIDVLSELTLLVIASNDENIVRFILDPFAQNSHTVL